jgi:hypothetical protein
MRTDADEEARSWTHSVTGIVAAAVGLNVLLCVVIVHVYMRCCPTVTAVRPAVLATSPCTSPRTSPCKLNYSRRKRAGHQRLRQCHEAADDEPSALHGIASAVDDEEPLDGDKSADEEEPPTGPSRPVDSQSPEPEPWVAKSPAKVAGCRQWSPGRQPGLKKPLEPEDEETAGAEQPDQEMHQPGRYKGTNQHVWDDE